MMVRVDPQAPWQQFSDMWCRNWGVDPAKIKWWLHGSEQFPMTPISPKDTVLSVGFEPGDLILVSDVEIGASTLPRSSVAQLPRDPAAEAPVIAGLQENTKASTTTTAEEPERQMHWRVPHSVYRVLVYLVTRAVQRARNRQLEQVSFQMATHRRWKRRVFQLVNQRLRHYQAAQRRAEEERRAWTEDQDELLYDDQDLENVEGPRPEKRDRTKTTKGREYLKRRKQKQREKDRLKGRQERLPAEVPPPWRRQPSEPPPWRVAPMEEDHKASPGESWGLCKPTWSPFCLWPERSSASSSGAPPPASKARPTPGGRSSV